MLQLSINNGQYFLQLNDWVIMPQRSADDHNIAILGNIGTVTAIFSFTATEIACTKHLMKKADIGNQFIVLGCEMLAKDEDNIVIDYLQYLSCHPNETFADWINYLNQVSDVMKDDAVNDKRLTEAKRLYADEDANGRVTLPLLPLTLCSSTIASYPIN